MCNQQSLRSACAYVQSDRSRCLLIEYSMTVNLLTEHHLEFLSLKGGCRGSSESTLVKMSNCWRSHVVAQLWSFSNTDLAYLHGLFLAHNLYFQMMQGRFCADRIVLNCAIESALERSQNSNLYNAPSFD